MFEKANCMALKQSYGWEIHTLLVFPSSCEETVTFPGQSLSHVVLPILQKNQLVHKWKFPINLWHRKTYVPNLYIENRRIDHARCKMQTQNHEEWRVYFSIKFSSTSNFLSRKEGEDWCWNREITTTAAAGDVTTLYRCWIASSLKVASALVFIIATRKPVILSFKQRSLSEAACKHANKVSKWSATSKTFALHSFSAKSHLGLGRRLD